jgi:hypothetical protein
MGERNGANAQTRVELKTARWRARREIDELTADGPAPIRFHRQVPFRGADYRYYLIFTGRF